MEAILADINQSINQSKNFIVA